MSICLPLEMSFVISETNKSFQFGRKYDLTIKWLRLNTFNTTGDQLKDDRALIVPQCEKNSKRKLIIDGQFSPS